MLTLLVTKTIIVIFILKLSECGEHAESDYSPEEIFPAAEEPIRSFYDNPCPSNREDCSRLEITMNDGKYFDDQPKLPQYFGRRNNEQCARKCDQKSKNHKIIEKKSKIENEIAEEKRRNTALKSLFQSTLPLPCSCESNYRLMDLGHSYFPRYLPTAECQPITCWNPPYTCQEKYYKVKVLRKRKIDTLGEPEPVDFELPESIRNHWVSEPLTVTVACECST